MIISVILCVEFPQMQCIDLSEIVHVDTAVIIVISVHLNSTTLFVVSYGLRAKVSSEWRLIPGFGTQKKCPFTLNRGTVYSLLTDTSL